jgi:hypothetical protein
MLSAREDLVSFYGTIGATNIWAMLFLYYNEPQGRMNWLRGLSISLGKVHAMIQTATR